MNIDGAIRQAHYARGYSMPPANPEEEARLALQAKSFVVTKLPYSGERQCLRFDRRTSKGRGTLSKSLRDGNLSFSDYQNGMHISSRATANEMRLLYTPIFAN